MKHKDVLTEQEYIEVKKLKSCLAAAQTRSDINYYSNEINKILDRAEARYYASKQNSKSEQAAAIAQ